MRNGFCAFFIYIQRANYINNYPVKGKKILFKIELKEYYILRQRGGEHVRVH